MCAGVIGAVGNNEYGIAGVCWNIELVSLRISENGVANASNVIAAINHAQQYGIDVLNLSYGWAPYLGNMSRYDYLLGSAIANYSGVFVCAAGNDSVDIDDDDYTFYPPEHNTARMITVGASQGNRIADISNYGAETVDLFAPGHYIFSTFTSQLCNDSGCSGDDEETDCIHTYYHKSVGTSFAAPYVAGTAALLLCIDKDLSPITIKNAIMNSVDKQEQVNHFDGKCVSGGRLNVFKAIMEITDHSNHIKSYSNSTASTHTVTCSTCNYKYSEAHIQYSGVPNTSATSHTATCFVCGYSGSFPHEWSDMITFYKCMICGKTTTAAPEIMLVAAPPNKDEEDISE